MPSEYTRRDQVSSGQRDVERADKTLFEIRAENEEKLNSLRNALMNQSFQKQADSLTKLHQMEMTNTKQEIKYNIDLLNSVYKQERANYNDLMKYKRKLRQADTKEEKDALKKKYKEEKQAYKKSLNDLKTELRKSGAPLGDRLAIRSESGDKRAVFERNMLKGVEHALDGLLNNFKSMFQGTIDSYASYQARINTRLQGSGQSWNGSGGIFSRGGIEYDIRRAVGVQPYVKLQDVMDNVVKATEQGIAYNIEQRAFLQTISENIASTFNAFDSNLARIIRLQQSDSTAARLGLEAGLTQFFNSYFSDTSYLTDSFDAVSQNLIETTSQMGSEEAVAFEYVVQKWLGSLASVGFGSGAISNIASALGMLGSGNVSGLASSGAMQNLLVMAANRANLNYSDLLTGGLTAKTTNTLLQSMVNYLQEIAESDNKVVKSQYAQIFGMSVSDLKAVENLKSSVNDISKSMMGYSEAVNELYSQMGQLSSRLGIGKMMENIFANSRYGIASSIAGNPALYGLWQVTSMIEDLTGGIALPTVSVLGNSVDLNTTVTNLMRTGIVGAGTLGMIGDIISGLATTSDPAKMLANLGVSSSATTQTRGTGLGRRSRGSSLSSSVFVGTSSGEDYYQASIVSADTQKDTLIQAQKDEDSDITLIKNNVSDIKLLLEAVTNGDKTLAVRFTNSGIFGSETGI